MIGAPAPDLDDIVWQDGKPHPLSEDHGRVVLVRWWTDTCPLCANSAPAITRLQKKHGNKLSVRAVYHDKVDGRKVNPAMLGAMAKRTGFDQLVGLDRGWAALRRWWLAGHRRSYTSVTFILDKSGRVRLIHTGGEFHARDEGECVSGDPDRCQKELQDIDRMIGALAAE